MKKNIKRFIIITGTMLCAAAFSGCGNSSKEETTTERITEMTTRVTTTEVTTEAETKEAKTETTTAANVKVSGPVTDYVGASVDIPNGYTIKSSDESVLKVANGKITAVGAGNCDLIVYDASGKATQIQKFNIKEKQAQTPKQSMTQKGEVPELKEGSAKADLLSVERSYAGSPYVTVKYILRNKFGRDFKKVGVKISLLDSNGNVLTTESDAVFDVPNGTSKEKSVMLQWSGSFASANVKIDKIY